MDDEPAPRHEVLAFAISLQDLVTPNSTDNVPATKDTASTSPPHNISSQPVASAPVTDTSSTATVTGTDTSSPDSIPEQSETAPEAVAGVSEGRRSERQEAVEEKRVRNNRITQGLGVVLAFPTYKEGVSAIFDGVIAPFTAADIRFLQGVSNREN